MALTTQKSHPFILTPRPRKPAGGAGRTAVLLRPQRGPLPSSADRPLMRNPWIVTLAVLVSLAALLPLGFVVVAAMQAGWATVATLVFRPRVGELLRNTLLLLACTLPLCTALALALAWLTERSDLPGGRVWSWLAVAPLAVPAFVHGYAWVTLVPGLHGLAGAVLVAVLAYTPFLYLPIVAALRRCDPALEDSAASLGLAPWRVWRRVVLPQMRLALCGGGLLIGLHLLAEYGLFVMVRFDTFTTAIMDQFQSAYDSAAANMLAAVLALCCLALLAGESRLRGTARAARLGAGAPRPPRPARLGVLWPCWLLVPGLYTLLALGVPLVTLGRWLLAGGESIWRWSEIGPALASTLLFAGLGAVLTTLAAVPMAWLAVRAAGRLSRILEGSNYITGCLPGVVVGLALVTLTVHLARPLYQSVATIVFAYMLLYLPRAMLSLRASLAQAPPELEQAAASLGRSPGSALWAVTMRLAAPGAAAGMALVALGIANELPATQMLAPTGTQTLATAFWAYTGEIDYAAAAPYALLMILFSLPMTWLLHSQSRRIAGR
ncbi:MAG TPA: iron ABC transporter permease [Acetobacteraceae bacterium]|nr:iron ABC transporter permease [Acetobacteraceae bacterium]